ncbi:MAG: DUF1365 domain-containing protein [Gammaproteobacteria bacterium]|nr:DUF1365 domain-containing protein [Gammaproteobacteria bacterium]
MTHPGPQRESAIYTGFVRHRRFTPTRHQFQNKLFMLLIKADELPDLLQEFWQLGTSRFSWARFRREDYVGTPDTTIEQAVKDKIVELSGQPEGSVDGDVFLLGHLRYFGFYFSPLNLYYLRQDGHFKYMLAEVSNTPWHEKHYYLVDFDNIQPHAKAFHVSPFNPMEQKYQWRLLPPEATNRRCVVQIRSSSADAQNRKVMDATLNLVRRPLNQKELSYVLLRMPMQTLAIVAGIYWQALRLFIKKTPFYPHPGKAQSDAEGSL